MNLSPSRVHDLISEDIDYISVVFTASKEKFIEGTYSAIYVTDHQANWVASKGIKTYTYKTLKTDNIKVGDIVNVPVNASQEIKSALVVFVANPEEFADSSESNYDVRWIIGKVNIEDFIKNQQSESQWLKQYKAMQSKSLRAQLLRAQFGDDVKMLAPRGNLSATEKEIKND